MTPELLHHALETTLGRAGRSIGDRSLTELLDLLETEADARPDQPELAEAVRVTHHAVTAGDGLPPLLGTIRREALVRWDNWTTTWAGVDTATGAAARVRVLRPYAAKDPVWRRALFRDGRMLARAQRPSDPPILEVEGPMPAIAVSHGGVPLLDRAPFAATVAEDQALVWLGYLVDDLLRLENAGLGLPRLAATELVLTEVGIRLMTLTPTAERSLQIRIREAGAVVDRFFNGAPPEPVDGLIHTWMHAPPSSAADAYADWTRLLVEMLTGRHHGIASRIRTLQASDRRSRLTDAVERLMAAVPAPAGRGALGVGLSGETMVLEGRAGELRWGAAQATLTPVYSPADGLSVRDARRVIRLRAASPDNPRLHAAVGGDAAFIDRACRWLAASLQLRTTSRLLFASRGEDK